MYKIKILSKPKVTVITTFFNLTIPIEDTINSVLSQTYTNVEYIIIIEGDLNGIPGVLKKYENRIRFLSLVPNIGVSQALNRGIIDSTGEIILIVPPGDCLEMTTIEDTVKTYEKFPYYDIYYGNCNVINTAGSRNIYSLKNEHLRLPEHMYLFQSAILIQKNAFLKYGPFHEEYQIAMDYEWLLRAYISGGLFLHINSLFSYHKSDGIHAVNYKERHAECLMAKKIYTGR